MIKLRQIALLGVAAVVGLASAGADEAKEPQSAAKQQEKSNATGTTRVAGGAAAGLIAVRDESGALRAPTPEEARELLPARPRSSQAPIASVGPLGSRRLVVAPRSLKFLAVTRTADGKLVYGHVEDGQSFGEFDSQVQGVRNDR